MVIMVGAVKNANSQRGARALPLAEGQGVKESFLFFLSVETGCDEVRQEREMEGWASVFWRLRVIFLFWQHVHFSRRACLGGEGWKL